MGEETKQAIVEMLGDMMSGDGDQKGEAGDEGSKKAEEAVELDASPSNDDGDPAEEPAKESGDGVAEDEDEEDSEEEAGETEDEDEDGDEEGDELAGLRAELEASLKGKLFDDIGKPPVETPAADETAAAPADEPDPATPVDFIGDLDMEDLLDSKDKLNSLLNKVRDDAMKLGAQQVLKSIPQIVDNSVNSQVTLTQARDKFYRENDDLVPYGNLVGLAVMKISEKDPTRTVDSVLADAAKVVRNTLRLKRKAETKGNRKGKKGNFENTPKGKKTKGSSKLKGMAADIADMIESTP